MAVTGIEPCTPLGSSALAQPQHHRSPNKASLTPNVANVVLGNLHIKPQYPSFYPEDLVGGRRAEWLYVCQWCFKYTAEIMKFSAHCKACPLKSQKPPGRVVYEKDDIAIHEVDGEENKLYAQNVSLFAKLFLETKSVFFDASTFLYYLLVLKSPSEDHPYQVAGFFSKEKMSWDNNNLACILVFPPFQRRSLGQVLIGASYVLGRKEGRFGGPEKPLSSLGQRGYLNYWSGEIARAIAKCKKNETLSIKELSEQTWILPEDLVTALNDMGVVEGKTHSGNIVVDKGRVKAWAERNRISPSPVVDEESFLIGTGESEEDEDEVEDSEEMEE